MCCDVSLYCAQVSQENVCTVQVQGADDKLGQFLDQDFEASANHRNVLRNSLESCPSLVSPNVKKTINIYKNV
jgi:hypothetical protein